MAESVFGWEAAPHPSSTEKWSLQGTMGGSESGSFKLKLIVSTSVGGTTAAIAYNANAAAIQAAIRALPGCGAVTATGSLSTGVTIGFPFTGVVVKVDGASLTDGTSTLAATRTQAGVRRAGNATITSTAPRVDGTISRPSYLRDYTHGGTETYVNPNGNSVGTPRGGVTATAPPH